MREQIDLIEAGDWRMLIVLDACRADVFREVTGGGECVQSPGGCTPRWLAAVGPRFASMGAVYFNANPVVTREARRRKLGLDLRDVWRDAWFWVSAGDLRIPSVHPMTVTSAVMRELSTLRGRPIVVHYLQPHSPYIGNPPLAMARWSNGKGLQGACHKLPRPDRAIRRGELTREGLLKAYRGNLLLAWDAARYLAGQVEGPTVITADHGECLCEPEVDGKFGHEDGWRYPVLRRVPWLVIDGVRDERLTTQQKLEALGYA